MHHPIVENSPEASIEASSEPSYISDLFGADAEAAAPDLLCDVISDVTAHCSASPQTVVVVALATLAAAIGPKAVVVRGRQRHSPTFNVIVSHCCPRTLPWMDALVAPFLGRVFDLQTDLGKRGPDALRAEDARRQQELARARQTISPSPELVAHLEAETDRSDARLHPFAATSGVAPKELAGLLPRTFDGGITLVAAANDPGSDFLRLKPAERAHLAQLLNRTWSSTPLGFGTEVRSGCINLLWATRQSPARLIGPHGFDPDSLVVPTLVFTDETRDSRLPEFASEARWDQTVGYLFDRRCIGRERVFTLHPDAEAILANFGAHIAAQGSVPTAVRPHVEWLPELAARLAVIYWVSGDHDEAVIDAEITSAALETAKWIGCQHVASVARAVRIDSVDFADDQTKLLAKIRSKAPITRRDLRRTFENQRVRWFDTALDALLEAKRVRYNDEILLVPCL